MIITGISARSTRPVARCRRPAGCASVSVSISRRQSARSSAQSAGATSTSQTSAPVWRTALALAMKVRLGTITRSPGPIPSPSSAILSATVPEDTTTARSVPLSAAMAPSNRSTKGPTEDTKVLLTHSWR